MKFTCSRCKEPFQSPQPQDGGKLHCPTCGFDFLDPEATTIDGVGPVSTGKVVLGRELGGFLIEEPVGTGAMGVVYRATQVSLDRTVALKVLPPAFSEKPALVERFYEESSALSALNHPNIVTIIDRGNVGNIYFFVMEFVDGPSLQKVMEQPVTVELFLKVAKGTAAALSYAHARGVVHRDIKPANIMIDARHEVKVADFGLAGLMRLDEDRTADAKPKSYSRMGTPAYMSPEQKKDSLHVDGRTDIYAAGVVFYEMLVGQRPQIPLQVKPSQVAEAADPRLDPIVAKCLEETTEARYATAEELLEDLTRFESEVLRAPHCPSCGQVGPVRFEKCLYCGEDLSGFFDICPECKKRNRREVRRCLHCAADLERGRTLISNRVTMVLDQADRHRLEGNFDEAIQMLSEIGAIEGKAFEAERARAATLRGKTRTERQQAARKAYKEGWRLLREQRFNEAIKFFKQVPTDIKDTTEAIQTARELQARLAAQKRSKSITNLIATAAGLIVLLVLVLLILSARH